MPAVKRFDSLVFHADAASVSAEDGFGVFLTDASSAWSHVNVYVSGALDGWFGRAVPACRPGVGEALKASSSAGLGVVLFGGSTITVRRCPASQTENRRGGTRRDEYDIDLVVRRPPAAPVLGGGVCVYDEVRAAVLQARASTSASPVAAADAPAPQRSTPVMPRAKDIITRLSTAAEIGEDETIELVYDQFYRELDAGEYPVIDDVLRVLNPKKHRNSVLLSILTATALSPAKAALQYRDGFYTGVKACLTVREGVEAAEELLIGLE